MVYKNQFDKYVISYFKKSDDEIKHKIKLKKNHSYSVMEISKNISRNIFSNLKDIELSKICGLYHDIGRFKQIYKYNTFRDDRSIDHGDLGSNIIDKLVFDLNKEDYKILKFSIYYHNKYKLPIFENERLDKHIKLIRDADKIDIYRVICENYIEKIRKINDDISDNIIEKFIKKESINYSDLKTKMDFYVLKFSWLFILNNDISYKIIKQQGYLKEIYNNLPKTKKVKYIYEKIYNYI